MPDDQAQKGASGAEGLSPEIADLFLVEPSKAAETKSPEKVTPAAEGKTADPNKPDGQVVPPVETDKDKKPEAKEGEEKKEPEKKPNEGGQPAPTKFSVGGNEYDSIEKAIEAVNRINGDNSRLAGDLTAAQQKAIDAENAIKAKDIQMQAYIDANLAWQNYFEGKGEKPEAPQVNLDELLDKKLAEREKQKEQAEKQKEQASLKEKYIEEVKQIVAKPDYNEVKAEFDKMMNEFDGAPKVSPLTLYERAQNLIKAKNAGKDLDTIKKEIEEKLRKEFAKQDVNQVGGKSGGGGSKQEDKMSPEIADLFRNMS